MIHHENPISEIRKRTIGALLDGYKSLSVPQLFKPLSANFTHRVLPSSLGMPPRDRESFALHAQGIFSIFTQFRMVPEEMYEDPSRGVIIIHARMEGRLKKGKPGAQVWTNECVMMIRLSADGTEVEEIIEFVDSAKCIDMRRLHAPSHFGGLVGAGEGGTYAAKAVLFSCVAVGTFFSVRRFMYWYDRD